MGAAVPPSPRYRPQHASNGAGRPHGHGRGATAAEYAVRSRDKVQMTARKGPLVVVLRGAEAQQQGRVGEWINVKNLQSNRIVAAKVVGPGEVEIPLQ